MKTVILMHMREKYPETLAPIREGTSGIGSPFCWHGGRHVHRSTFGGRCILTVVLVACTLVRTVDATDPGWQPGISGGIPAVPQVNSVADFGAVGNGISDDSPAFESALGAVPSGGGAVFVPPGTYLLKSKIELRDGVVLRGAGAATTHLVFDLGGRTGHSIEVLTYERGSWVNVVGGYVEGSQQVTVANASGFTVPTFAEIEQENNPDIMYTDPTWNQYFAQNAVGEIVRVVGKVGNNLILEEPLHFSYDPGMNPRIRSQGFVEFAGIEDLHLKRLDDGYGGMILLKNAAWVWVRGVESEYASTFHVGVYTVYHCEIRESYFHHALDYGGGGYGYGVALDRHTTGCLVEDNLFVHLRHSMLMSIGANANVLGYNYSREPFWTEFGSPPDVAFHGHYPYKNLVEGNVTQEIVVSDFWGPAGPGNTILRNCVLFENLGVYDHSDGQNIIGNMLGEDSAIYIHPSVQQTFVHGNFVNGGLQWDPGVSDHTIPTSLYLSSKPSFFGSLPWPAIGGDVGLDCENPAVARWQSGQPTPSVTFQGVFFDGFETGDSEAWSGTSP